MSGGEPGRLERAVTATVRALGLERPRVQPLDGGVANRSFRLRDGRTDVVLKLTGDPAAALGAHARAEIAMQTLAADAGLAPPIVFADEPRGFIVSRHVVGRTPAADDMRASVLAGRVGAWLARLHALEAPQGLPVVDFAARAAGYLRRMRAARADAFAEFLLDQLMLRKAAIPPPARLAPCHHDLHHRNFLDDGRSLLAVDWEYAGPGDPAADLASFIGYHRPGPAALDALFAAYGGGGALRTRVETLGWIFDCLWYGWNAAASLAGLDTDAGEQAEIAARLGA